MQISCQKRIELVLRRKQKINLIVDDLDRKDFEGHLIAGQAFARLQREGSFVQRAGDLGNISLTADDAPRKHECPLVRAHVLSGVPLAAARELEDGDLYFTVLDRGTPFDGKIGNFAYLDPLGLGIFARRRFVFGGLGERLDLQQRAVLGPVGGPVLASFGDDLDAVFCFVRVDELAESLAALGIFDDLRPLALIRVD